MNSMLSFEEVKSFLDLEQKELEQYIQEGKLHAYKIGGTYLRFRKEEVANLRYGVLPRKGKLNVTPERSFFSHVIDFWNFNNFYVIALLLVLLAVYWLLSF